MRNFIKKIIVILVVIYQGVFLLVWGAEDYQWKESQKIINYKDPVWAKEEPLELDVIGGGVDDDARLNFPVGGFSDYLFSRNFISKYLPMDPYHCEGFDFPIVISKKDGLRKCSEIIYLLADISVGDVRKVLDGVLGKLKIELAQQKYVSLIAGGKKPPGWEAEALNDLIVLQINKMVPNLNLGSCPGYLQLVDAKKIINEISPFGGRTIGAPVIHETQLDGSYDFDEVWVVDVSPYFGGSASLISLQSRKYRKVWYQSRSIWMDLPFPLNLARRQEEKHYVPANLVVDVVNLLRPSVGPRGIRVTDSFTNWVPAEDRHLNRCFPKKQQTNSQHKG